MKLRIMRQRDAPQVFAKRWGLTIQNRVAETPRATIYKVDGPQGASALKIYKQLGSSGEGAGIQFLRELESGAGAKIYRCNLLRTAVLMEWLAGPSLKELLADGQEDAATRHLAHVAGAVARTDFKLPIRFRRMLPGQKRDLANSLNAAANHPNRSDLMRAIALFDHLAQTTTQERVIHGDLLFGNVILTPDGPRLIDPKGLRHDPSFDFGKALVDPFHKVTPDALVDRIARRAPVMADAIGEDPIRLAQWAAVSLALRVFSKGAKDRDNPKLAPHLAAVLAYAER